MENIMAENKARLERNRAENTSGATVDEVIDIEKCRDDFEYWAVNAVRIRDKLTGRNIPFRLNRAQRHLLGVMEEMRRSGRPIRIILLKARQLGGSTLIQVYMSWIQMIHRKNWHSVICAHVKDSARNIRAMFTQLLGGYPEALNDDGEKRPMKFVPFEGAQNVRLITGRDCRVAVASAESQDSMRGSDIAMAHLSEVAFWRETPRQTPEELMRAICSSVPLEPYTLVAMESTANGVGNFFHKEWLRAAASENGVSDKKAVFIPWYMIDIYSLPVENPEEFFRSFNAYEKMLWERGCTLEQINWYRRKSAEYSSKEQMHAEFPTTEDEAFVASDMNVFSPANVGKLREQCSAPRTGELGAGGFTATPSGKLRLWSEPEAKASYVVAVDVGGRSERSDWSVIAVLKSGDRPEVAAQWRGHADHDVVANKAMDIAAFYNGALLVIESNTLESADDETSSASVLARVYRSYSNTFCRGRTNDALSATNNIGFHTNRHTKALIIDGLMEAVRENAYVERDGDACNEFLTYRRMPNGSYQAAAGYHDDILMTRAIALHILTEYPHHFAKRTPMPSTPAVFDW